MVRNVTLQRFENDRLHFEVARLKVVQVIDAIFFCNLGQYLFPIRVKYDARRKGMRVVQDTLSFAQDCADIGHLHPSLLKEGYKANFHQIDKTERQPSVNPTE